MKNFLVDWFASFSPYRRVLRLLIFSGIAIIILIAAGNLVVQQASNDRLYDSLETIPSRNAGLVLGCSRTLPGGRPNLYFRFRINAAAALYHSGKVRYLIVSGDNHRHDYDEPTEMRDALIEKGVPAESIYRDYAGFRTLDSVVRAREIFGQRELTIISQPFHNERAIFIAREHGIDAVGFNARDVESIDGLRTRLREHLARFKTVLDVWVLGTEPRFLGHEIALGGPAT
ncbi:MAG: YdcF family protein [Verrucomicrobiae bacterium]|nr:YdcF family protein [Verrucomicrobiae bacterium]